MMKHFKPVSICTDLSAARVCVCYCVRVRVCLRACDSVSTSQFNLLKIYVHPALPPLAPPQALNVSTAITFVSVLTSSKRGRAIS